MIRLVNLNDCERDDTGDRTRYTHESGAYVELIRDECPHHPLDDAEGIAIAFREGDRYEGTAPDYPRDPVIECSTCEGTGNSPDRFELRNWSNLTQIIGAGTEAAMEALRDLFGGDIRAIWCPTCKGNGDIDVDIETYFRVERGARAMHEFDTGSNGEATAVMYMTDDDWTDPESAVKAWVDEYQSWAEPPRAK